MTKSTPDGGPRPPRVQPREQTLEGNISLLHFPPPAKAPVERRVLRDYLDLRQMPLEAFLAEVTSPVLLSLVPFAPDSTGIHVTAGSHAPPGILPTGSLTADQLQELVVFHVRHKAEVDAGAPVTLGRSEQNDVMLPINGLSRCHCSISQNPNGDYEFTDLGSTNGSLVAFVRAQKEKPVRLADGALVVLGEAYLRFLHPKSFYAELQALTL